ncbi:META domain-containing protein [Eikenella sp. S3360]|uniref:META domain-containing protein n=1 Tax=Eikenella glucosivorans TaxID=2766967 RepID=A0ABS0NCH4_9NEIS|nr:META domain-containing protein [Eikenella glucosivorans]MBH5329981.1 META domain-containing protein [Eikenella glucosivorans]
MKPIYLAALLLAACAAHPADSAANAPAPSAPPAAQAEQPPLAGQWQITRIGNTRPAPRSMLSFHPEAKRFNAGVGCNTLGGSYRQQGHALSFGETVTTLMGCPQAIHRQERRLAENVLPNVAAYRLANGRLELLDSANRVLLQAVPTR